MFLIYFLLHKSLNTLIINLYSTFEIIFENISGESRHKKNKENDKYLADGNTSKLIITNYLYYIPFILIILIMFIFNAEVTTSMSEQQFMLPIINDKNSENIPVDEISSK